MPALPDSAAAALPMKQRQSAHPAAAGAVPDVAGSAAGRPPGFSSGRTSLDLVEAAAGSRLRSAADLDRWLHDIGLVSTATAPEVTGHWVRPFVSLGGALGRMVGSHLDGVAQRPSDVAALNRAALPQPVLPTPAAVIGPDGLLLRQQASRPPDCEGLLAVMARDGLDLLTDPVARSQLRRCSAQICPRVYVDTSRGRCRIWCSSEGCGNRDRVARHRRRRSTISRTSLQK